MARFYRIIFLLNACSIFGCSNPELPEDAVTGVQNPVILLNGIWKITLNPLEKFWESSLNTTTWTDIQVPGECQMQGFPIKHDQPFVYTHRFLIPSDFKGKQVYLYFHGVYSYARVWVNGNFVRDHSGGFTKWECDMYVEDETAVCFVDSHRMNDYQAAGATQNDSLFTPVYLSQLEEMVRNHRNHPCVTIWSIGNENVFGKN